MYIRITRGRIDPAMRDEVQRLVEAHIVPALKQLPGFRQYLGGINNETGILCAISLWDTEEQANFSREALAEGVRALVAAGVSLEIADVYELTVNAS